MNNNRKNKRAFNRDIRHKLVQRKHDRFEETRVICEQFTIDQLEEAKGVKRLMHKHPTLGDCCRSLSQTDIKAVDSYITEKKKELEKESK